MPDEAVPADVPELTPDWLTGVLLADGTLPAGHRVTAVSVTDIDGGAIARTVRLRLSYDRPVPGAPDTLVAKSPALAEQPRALAVMAGLYTREVRFYQDFAPSLPMRVPRCHAALLAQDTGGFALLLEDIADGTQHDQDDAYPPEDVLLALRELAALHAAHWDDPKLAEADWLNRLDEASVPMWQGLFEATWREFTAREEVVLDPELRALGDRLCATGVAGLLAADGPKSLTHADFHVSNMLFRDTPRGREVVTVDWQLAMHACPLLDVAYLIGRMPTDVRRAGERELVRAYHDALVAAGVAGYPREACWTDYRRWAWYGVISSLVAVLGTPLSPDEARRYTAKVTRYLTQVADLDSAEFLG